MDAIANLRSIASELPYSGPRVSLSQAEEAVRTLIRWAGDDPGREGLLETPARVARAYREWFGGYQQDPAEHLERTFEEISTYSGPILLRDIPFHSVCEHHMAPIRGVCHICYLPQAKVVGISKLARVVETIASRLQIQERLTAEIAETIDLVLRPRGVAVAVEAEHACMSTRGIRKHGITMETFKLIGAYEHDAQLRTEFLASIRGSALPQPR